MGTRINYQTDLDKMNEQERKKLQTEIEEMNEQERKKLQTEVEDEDEAKYLELVRARFEREARLGRGGNEGYVQKPPETKTILGVQRLAQKFLEDEILQYELYLFSINEKRSEDSETIQGLRGYLMYLYDDFEDGNYSEIQNFIDQYTNNEDTNQDTAYYKILEKYFAKARIDSLNAMIDLYFDKTYKYTTNDDNLNVTIDDFRKSNTLKKLLLLRKWTNDKTKARQKNVDYLIKVIKNEYSSANKEYNKDQIAWQIYERMEDLTSYDNIRKNYMIGWEDI
jgi:hypothetical protein